MTAFSAAVLLFSVAFLAALDGRYPRRYTALILEKSEKYALDPAFVAAIVCVESGFDPDALSKKGACGLMQIMPATAEWIAVKTGVGYSPEALFDADYNIEIGCAYLNYLSGRFSGETTVAAAYNAGEGNVKKWLSGSGKIEFPETAAYVEKVAAAENVYRARLRRAK